MYGKMPESNLSPALADCRFGRIIHERGAHFPTCHVSDTLANLPHIEPRRSGQFSANSRSCHAGFCFGAVTAMRPVYEDRNPPLARPHIAGVRRGPAFSDRPRHGRPGGQSQRIRDVPARQRSGWSRGTVAGLGREHVDLWGRLPGLRNDVAGCWYRGHFAGLRKRGGRLAGVPDGCARTGPFCPARLRSTKASATAERTMSEGCSSLG